MLAKRNLIFIVALLCVNASANHVDISSKCHAIYYKNGFSAGFPIIKKKMWEWYKKAIQNIFGVWS